MLKLYKVLFNIILISIISFQNVIAACNNNSKADLVLEEMMNNYQSFHAYKDTGKVITNNGNIRKFKTTFETPDKFTFQWTEETPYSINKIWGENKTASYLRSYKKKPQQMSINDALGSAAGVSGGVSYLILPWILLRHDPCLSINLTKNKIINEVNYLNNDTYIIERIIKNGSIWKYWISKNKLLLRKLETKSHYKDRVFIDIIKFEHIEHD